ncbi:MAG: hypothetical protein H0T73_04375 [Ardenticatenales bacterium]|nr:hypothetical protein [Ardenticatenales bacterium]
MADELWYIEQQSRVLQEFRGQVSTHWDDEASREINLRYLDPHHLDDAKMLAALRQQHTALDEGEHKLGVVRDIALTIEEVSVAIEEYLESCKQEVRICYQLLEQYREYHSGAQSLFPKIEALINQANSVCKGVPIE